ncbi:MAG: hypothetical protein AAGK74_07965, partial [Chloroflexota bacterium]
IRDLRGRRVKMALERERGIEKTVGSVIGLDTTDAVTRVSLLTDNGYIRVYRLDELYALEIEDEEASRDLLDFLALNKSENEERTIRVSLTKGTHDIGVSYVAPSPNWRVSYRIIATTDEDETRGVAALLGWGLFDNKIEDLENVLVTLVAGAPISFQYDLYSSNIPERQRVRDTGYASQGPVHYDAPAPAPVSAGSHGGSKPARRRQNPISSLFSMIFNPYVEPMIAGRNSSQVVDSIKDRSQIRSLRSSTRESVMDVSKSTSSNTIGREAGEVFQYEVQEPVTVKKGVSALVPIINQGGMRYQRELLYNSQKVKGHPVTALRLTNTTGLTLEQGPVTVVENGDYRGEAVVPFTRDGATLYLTYAVERGVKVTEQTKTRYEREANHYIREVEYVEETYNFVETTWTIENNTSEDKTVRIESQKHKDYDLFESDEPEVETAGYRWWSVVIPANRSIDFKVTTRKVTEYTRLLGGGCNPLGRVVVWMMGNFRGVRVAK